MPIEFTKTADYLLTRQDADQTSRDFDRYFKSYAGRHFQHFDGLRSGKAGLNGRQVCGCARLNWMNAIAERIRTFIDDDEASRLLSKYYAGGYTGSRFDTSEQLRSPNPNRFTTHDIAAVATLSVPLSGSAVVELLEQGEALGELLRTIDPDISVVDDEAADLMPALYELQAALDDINDVGHVTRSKLLAHKRPQLVPIRDQHVLRALIGTDHGSFTEPLRDALRSDEAIIPRINALRGRAPGVPNTISALRVLDVVVWMAAHGDA